MARFLLTLLCVLFLGQSLALAAVSSMEECTVSCADDSTDGSCTPTCSDCGCCTHGAQPLIAPLAAAPPSCAALEPLRLGDRASAPAGALRDVFHVPLSLLA